MQRASSSCTNTRCNVQHAPCNVRTLSRTSLRPSSRSSRPLRSASSRMRKSQTLAPRGSCRGQYPMISQAARYPPRGSCRVITVLHCTMRCGAVRCGAMGRRTVPSSTHTILHDTTHRGRSFRPPRHRKPVVLLTDRPVPLLCPNKLTAFLALTAAPPTGRIASHRIASHRIARSVATSTASVAQRLSAWQQQRVERSGARRCVATR